MSPARVAFVGKGGAGKSVVAGTFARLLGRRGRRVLAVDSDPMPGLAISLGVQEAEAPLPTDILEEVEDAGGRRTQLTISALEAAERYALSGPDGVMFLQFGKLRGPVWPMARSQDVFRHILRGMASEPWDVVGDLPGGTRQPFFGWGNFADTVVIVAEPTSTSMLTARRLTRLAHAESGPRHLVAVANKVRNAADASLLAEATGLDVLAAIPLDATIAEADRQGRPPLDVDPRGRAVEVIGGLVDAILSQTHAASG